MISNIFFIFWGANSVKKKLKMSVQDEMWHLEQFESESKVVFTYSVLERKYTFRANLVQKIKIICLRSTLTSRLIRICYFFCFGLKIPCFGQSWSTKSKLSVWDETWCLDKSKYAEFNSSFSRL